MELLLNPQSSVAVLMLLASIHALWDYADDEGEERITPKASESKAWESPLGEV